MKKTFATLVILAGLFAPFSNAHAVSGIFGCSAAGVGGALISQVAGVAGAGEVPVQDRQTDELAAKECILDGLVVALRQAMITTITQSIVDWINSGFDGAPAFVTDLSTFLDEVADNVALDFIEGTELGFLCSPFELQVRLSLAVSQQPFQEHISCSLGDVTDNIEGFLSGDFSQGGWPAWFRLHTDINNSPYGAYASASIELAGRQTEAINEELEELRWGSGFFSKTRCNGAQNPYRTSGGEVEEIDTSSESGCTEAGGTWEIVTPGSQINEQLAEVLGSGFEQLELADELDEIISALLAQLAQQVFTSIDGLRGLSSPSSSSSRNNGSYLQNLSNEAEGGSVSSASSVLIRDINAAIEIEEAYQGTLNNLIALHEETKLVLQSKYQCLSGAGFPTQANTASTTISAVIDPNLNRYETNLETSTDTISDLLQIRADVNSANTTSELNAAADAYDAILASGIVHTTADISLLEQELEQSIVSLESALTRLEFESSGQCFND